MERKIFVLAPNPQHHQSGGAESDPFTVLCGPDSNSGAPMDGFTGPEKKSGSFPEFKAEESAQSEFGKALMDSRVSGA